MSNIEQDETQQYGDAQQTIIALQQKLDQLEQLRQIQQQQYELYIGNLEEKLRVAASGAGAGASTHTNNDSDDDFFDICREPKQRKKIPRKNSVSRSDEDAGNMVTNGYATVALEVEIVSESNPEEAELAAVNVEELGGEKQLIQDIESFEVQIPAHSEDHVHFSTYNGLRTALSDYEIETISKFVVVKSTADFNVETTLRDILNSDMLIHIKWEMKHSTTIPFSGTPFIYLGRQDYECHQGSDKHAKGKELYKIKQKLAKQRKDHGYSIKTRKRIQNTKKLDCPLTFCVKKIFKFPSFSILINSDRKRRKATINLKTHLAELHNERTEGAVEELRSSADLVYITQFPNPLGHRNHEVGEAAGLVEPLDERVANYIKTQIRANCLNTKELRERAELYVSEVIFNGENKTPTHRRRFYPSRNKLRNLVTSVKNETNRSNGD